MYRATSGAAASAQARSGVASIAAALQMELANTNTAATAFFADIESGQWKTLSSDQYHSLLGLLKTHHSLDISPDRLDPWGSQYRIDYKKNQELLIRVSSAGPGNQSEDARDLEVAFQVPL